ncbi:hypothetical protein BSM4216_0139 [Bacillus smithii]|nr:hypothetical protein BSM4216_0139 [Bacillus smithii]
MVSSVNPQRIGVFYRRLEFIMLSKYNGYGLPLCMCKNVLLLYCILCIIDNVGF